MSLDLLAFGDPCADVVLGTDTPPALGEKVLGRPLGVFPGGTTANVACAISRLGRRSAVYGRVGDDTHGGLLRESLQRFGVGVEHLAVVARTASASVIAMIAASGERAIVYMPMLPSPLDEAAFATAARRARIVYAMPYDAAEFALISRIAHENGALVAIDIEAAVAPDSAAMQQRIERADIVFFNESGFRAGSGEAPSHAAMARLLSAGPRMVVVTRGAAGALGVDRHGFAEHPALPHQVVDTTGAGDTFNAAFLAATLEEQGLRQALRFACAAASCTVAAIGARAGMPDRRSVDALVARAAAELGGMPC